ncbi:hypothetical protein ABT112_02780 [Streptomyces sp. NPDC002055]|uniref:hypothetical protein n=1 Tax=Streptomyces sp. NPDC002055 TaxID=3154534 RepID=UPI003333B826
MASLVYFHRLEENEDGVRYLFGPDPEEMHRTLTLDKGIRRSLPDDGTIDHAFLKASQKINSIREERGTWPLRGFSAS